MCFTCKIVCIVERRAQLWSLADACTYLVLFCGGPDTRVPGVLPKPKPVFAADAPKSTEYLSDPLNGVASSIKRINALFLPSAWQPHS